MTPEEKIALLEAELRKAREREGHWKEQRDAMAASVGKLHDEITRLALHVSVLEAENKGLRAARQRLGSQLRRLKESSAPYQSLGINAPWRVAIPGADLASVMEGGEA